MATEISRHEPFGQVRGTAIEMVELRGKSKRVAHAFLPTGSQVQTVDLDVPKTLSLAELRVVAKSLLAFADAVESA
jgi:hypothetical protein